jgi:hypothetical protein
VIAGVRAKALKARVLSDKGFVVTGIDLGIGNLAAGATRPSYQFETSLRSVFAVGDVRAGSVCGLGMNEGRRPQKIDLGITDLEFQHCLDAVSFEHD